MTVCFGKLLLYGTSVGILNFNGYDPSAGHSIAGIDRKIQDRLMEMPFVSHDDRVSIRKFTANNDRFRQEVRQKIVHVFHYAANGNRLQVGLFGTREQQ